MLSDILKDKKIIDGFLNKGQTFLSGMLGALIVLLIMEWVTPEQKIIATVDITRLTQNFIKKEQEKNISQEVIKQEAVSFGRQLEKSLKLFAEKNHLILLPREAVMAGSQDYTSVIAQTMEQSLIREEDAV